MIIDKRMAQFEWEDIWRMFTQQNTAYSCYSKTYHTASCINMVLADQRCICLVKWVVYTGQQDHTSGKTSKNYWFCILIVFFLYILMVGLQGSQLYTVY